MVGRDREVGRVVGDEAGEVGGGQVMQDSIGVWILSRGQGEVPGECQALGILNASAF